MRLPSRAARSCCPLAGASKLQKLLASSQRSDLWHAHEVVRWKGIARALSILRSVCTCSLGEVSLVEQLANSIQQRLYIRSW